MFLSECERRSFTSIENNTVYINLYIFGQQKEAKDSPKKICASMFKLLLISESQLDRIALQRRILDVAGSITVCEANCPCRRFCTSPSCCAVNCIQQNTCRDAVRLVVPLYRPIFFKNRRFYKFFTLLCDVVMNLSQTGRLNF
jgi:hypothetical protein